LSKARFWIGIIISIVALVVAFRQVEFSMVWSALGKVNYWFLASSLVPLLLFLVLRAYRWRMLFYPRTGLRVGNLFAVINIGYLLSNIFPARLGDVARAYLIGDSEQVSRTTAFSTIIAERVLDALCAVAGLFIALPFAPLPDWMIRSGLAVGIAALVAVIAFVFLVRRREWTLRLLDRVLDLLHWPEPDAVQRFWGCLVSKAVRDPAKHRVRVPWAGPSRLKSLAGSLIDGLAGITTLRLGPALLLWSVVIWATISAFYWLVLLAFDTTQPFVAGLAVTSVTALGMTVPSSPGYVGVFHVLARETVGMFGMQPEVAVSYALVAHATDYLIFCLLGLICMAQQNLTYAKIQQQIATEGLHPR